MKFYGGQKVKITDDTCGHDIEIGRNVVIERADECSDGSWNLYYDGWVFDQDDCEPVIESE